MKLFGQKSFFLGMAALIGICTLPFTHSLADQRMMSVETTSVSIAEPTLNLYQLGKEQGLKGVEWTVFWRGTLPESEVEAWVQQLGEDFRATDALSDPSRPVNAQTNAHPQVQVWVKETDSSTHQLQIYDNPRKKNSTANFIYVWKGQHLHPDWQNEYKDIESSMFPHVDHFPESFSCLEGIADGKLFSNVSLDSWITDELKGEVTHRVSEKQYVSLNGYIPNWDQRSLSAGDQIINIQMSARYNALDGQTRVTLGYPLILTEH